MDNDSRLTISDPMLLASERLPIDLSPTPEITAKANLGIFWAVMGGLLCVFGLFIGNSKSHSGNKGGGE